MPVFARRSSPSSSDVIRAPRRRVMTAPTRSSSQRLMALPSSSDDDDDNIGTITTNVQSVSRAVASLPEGVELDVRAAKIFQIAYAERLNEASDSVPIGQARQDALDYALTQTINDPDVLQKEQQRVREYRQRKKNEKEKQTALENSQMPAMEGITLGTDGAPDENVTAKEMKDVTGERDGRNTNASTTGSVAPSAHTLDIDDRKGGKGRPGMADHVENAQEAHGIEEDNEDEIQHVASAHMKSAGEDAERDDGEIVEDDAAEADVRPLQKMMGTFSNAYDEEEYADEGAHEEGEEEEDEDGEVDGKAAKRSELADIEAQMAAGGKDVMQKDARYFSIANVVCGHCGVKGHLSYDCPEQAEQKRCFLCGKIGHPSRQCPSDTCFLCGKPGHRRRDCAEKDGKKGGAAAFDRNAQGSHTKFDANGDVAGVRKRRKYTPPRHIEQFCYVCGTLGHLDCSLGAMPQALVCCFNCGLVGHGGRECAEPRAERFCAAAIELDRERRTNKKHGGGSGRNARRKAEREVAASEEEVAESSESGMDEVKKKERKKKIKEMAKEIREKEEKDDVKKYREELHRRARTRNSFGGGGGGGARPRTNTGPAEGRASPGAGDASGSRGGKRDGNSRR